MAEHEIDVTADQLLSVAHRPGKFPHWEIRLEQEACEALGRTCFSTICNRQEFSHHILGLSSLIRKAWHMQRVWEKLCCRRHGYS